MLLRTLIISLYALHRPIISLLASECQQASSPPCGVFWGYDWKNNLCKKYIGWLYSAR